MDKGTSRWDKKHHTIIHTAGQFIVLNYGQFLSHGNQTSDLPSVRKEHLLLTTV